MIADLSSLNENYHNKKSEIESSSNNLFFSNVQVQNLVENECRICLQGNSQSQNRLQSPCNCQGSLKYVHENCLRLWIKSIIQSKFEGRYIDEVTEEGIQCEICKNKIYFDIDLTNRKATCEEIREKISQKKVPFGILILLLSLTIGVITFSMYKLLSDSDLSLPIIILLVLSIILMFGFNLFGLYFLISHFFVEFDINVGQLKKLVKGKIVPLSRLTN